MRLTLIHPCIGRRPGEQYMRTWQMESLPAATIAGLTPDDVDLAFYDDRLESIPYDEPTDAVALSVETYTAKRSYQIASEYRKRGVPVIMGGFHATLCSDEVSEYAEAVVEGEAENVWAEVIDDLRHGALKRRYKSSARPSLKGVVPDRTIFRGKRYVPIGLVELGRGCRYSCDFCSIQAMFQSSYTSRPVEEVLEDIKNVAQRAKVLFLVDDNLAADAEHTKRLLRLMIPLKVKWICQAGMKVAYDDELLDLMARSGCRCILVGLESLDDANLVSMNKTFNTSEGDFETAIGNVQRHGIPVYGTFLFGYDADTRDSFRRALDFARRHALFIAAFNHVTPFPGTPLYDRLDEEGRLLYDPWWLDDEYSYGRAPFVPSNMSPDELERGCFAARRSFYKWASILRRGLVKVHRQDLFTFRLFMLVNAMHRGDIRQRIHHPFGLVGWEGRLLRVQ